ncbi:hypothetical protein D5Q63_02505 [Escherichia coli]|nr:hypothetical protein [Escherichia coli]EFN8524472.1 hypothetical protein [Escherichia coli O150]EEY5691393.1 hypothetical protein [Escherichia coli]EFO0373277.1 hypothetical protein [Escherichia coli]MHT12639.1 hypothetical protein [Escherichia coli]
MIRTGMTYRFKQRVTEAGAIRLLSVESVTPRKKGRNVPTPSSPKRIIYVFELVTLHRMTRNAG